jgi:hypothetical protein
VLAQNLLTKDSSSDNDIEKAFRLIICRKPSKQEFAILKSYYTDQLAKFKSNSLDAAKTLKVGEYPVKGNLDRSSHAALTKTISTIYNLEEAITRT